MGVGGVNQAICFEKGEAGWHTVAAAPKTSSASSLQPIQGCGTTVPGYKLHLWILQDGGRVVPTWTASSS